MSRIGLGASQSKNYVHTRSSKHSCTHTHTRARAYTTGSISLGKRIKKTTSVFKSSDYIEVITFFLIVALFFFSVHFLLFFCPSYLDRSFFSEKGKKIFKIRSKQKKTFKTQSSYFSSSSINIRNESFDIIEPVWWGAILADGSVLFPFLNKSKYTHTHTRKN